MKFSVVDLEMFRGVCKQMCLKTILLFLFNAQVVSSYLQPQRLQHPRLLCPPISLGIYSSSCPLSQWCHPTISSSVTPFSSYLQSFPGSRSFLVSQLFVSGGQSIGASAPSSEYSGLISFRINWFDILAVQGTLKSLLWYHNLKA